MTDWQQFFDGYADKYDDEVFTKNTEAELGFLVEHLGLKAGTRVLDIGCGTGRHTVGLAQRGCKVTGVDLSSGMLAMAQRRADDAGVAVELVHSNAADFRRPDAFDAAICLCEGSICLFAAGDDPLTRDQSILENVAASLVPGGGFILNVLSASRHFRMYSDDDVAAGRFDPINLTEVSEAPMLLGKDAREAGMRERSYTAPELARMLAWAGFDIRGIYGGTAGNWGLRPPLLDEYELMAIVSRR